MNGRRRLSRLAAALPFLLLAQLFAGASARQVADSTYYKLLGVPVDVSDAILKKAYHKLALQWHPDKHSQSPEEERRAAEDKFKEISLAYDTLSDPAKRKVYDQVGVEGMKRGDKGGGGGFHGGFDPMQMFEQMFKGFAGGGGFSFNMGGGGGGGLFADSADAIETLQDRNRLQELISESASGDSSASRQFVAILCIATNGDCKRLKAGLVKLAKSHKGAATFHAIDCMAQSTLCRDVEPNVARYPWLVYYGYKKKLPFAHDEGSLPEERITVYSIRRWLAKVVPDVLSYIKTASDHDSFLAAENSKAKLVFLTEKTGVPPRLKSLSMEFQHGLRIAFVSKQDAPDVFSSFVTPGSGREAPGSMPALYNVQARKFSYAAGDELRSYFENVAKSFHSDLLQRKSKLDELTLDLYDSGVCNATDFRFCLLAILPTKAELEIENHKHAFLNVRDEYEKDKADSLRVFYILLDKTSESARRMRTRLGPLLAASGHTDGGSGAALLWRPRWSRFERFDGDISSPGEVLRFVRSAFISAALHGESGLSQGHQEL